MNIDTFCTTYPQHCIDFSRPLKGQPRVYDANALADLPLELEPWANPPEYKGRGSVNVNQTRTHYQCVSCDRILRNDFFHLPPSFTARNRVFSYCRACYVGLNANAYEIKADLLEARRRAILTYLAPRCASCGFDQHPSAMDLHHAKDEKHGIMSELIARTAQAPTPHNAGQLLHEAKKCVPLCCNCHRLLHAGALTPGPETRLLHYTLVGLMDILRGAG